LAKSVPSIVTTRRRPSIQTARIPEDLNSNVKTYTINNNAKSKIMLMSLDETQFLTALLWKVLAADRGGVMSDSRSETVDRIHITYTDYANGSETLVFCPEEDAFVIEKWVSKSAALAWLAENRTNLADHFSEACSKVISLGMGRGEHSETLNVPERSAHNVTELDADAEL
jgi:hypothetical protein